MTQQQLAEKVGTSRQTIIAIEAGKYSPSLELAFRIAYAFGVKIGEVLIMKLKEIDKMICLKTTAKTNCCLIDIDKILIDSRNVQVNQPLIEGVIV